MDLIKYLIDFLLHFDAHIDFIVQNYNNLIYLVLFLIVFVETGLIIMPFLPGDSLLFAVGAISARGGLNPLYAGALMVCGAFFGDVLNYYIGTKIGTKIFASHSNRFLNKKYLLKAESFYKEHGTKTIIFARFLPIIRTFAPFVAGMGQMDYKKYISFSIFGAVLWVTIFISLGHFFGNLAFIKNNFKYVIVAIIIISFIPAVIEFLKEKKKRALNS